MGRSALEGVSDGEWSVFAEKVVKERDEALAELALTKSLHDVAVRQRDAANWLVEQLTNERDEARTEILALKECLRWYVENDDTIAGGKWDEDNATWLEGKRRAMRLLGMEVGE